MSDPVLHFLDLARLRDAREHADADGGLVADALRRLKEERGHALRAGPFSVVDKELVAPSGDLHDFMSIPTYFWPNPDTPDGLPWVFIDGNKNPQVSELDSPRLFKMTNAFEVLVLHAWYDGEARAAERAALLLRTWFLDPATRMNPHLTYAQLELGKPRGNSIGIIDFQRCYLLLDLLQLLRSCSDAVTDDEDAAIRAWFAELLDWLVTSEMGAEECARLTNHGTWFDAQVVAYRLLLGDVEGAGEWLRTTSIPRMERQITPEGDQPLESARVSALQYCVFNLFGLCVLAELGSSAGVDLWNHEGPEGQGIRRALDWLLPYLAGDPGVGGPITKHRGSFSVSAEATMTLRLAAERYGDPRYEDAHGTLWMKRPGCRSDALLPPRT